MDQRWRRIWLTCLSIGMLIVVMLGFWVIIQVANEQVAQIEPTETLTFTPTFTLTLTPTATATFTPTFTPSPTFTPTPTPIPPSVILDAIDQTAFLESARTTLNLPNVHAENDWPGILPGKRSLSYNANVIITAGIDFERFDLDSIRIEGSTVTIQLPPPQVRDCILDEANSFYFDRKCSAAGVVDAGCGGLEDVLRVQAMYAAATYDHEVILDAAFASAAELVQKLVLTVSGVQTVQIERSQEPIGSLSEAGICHALANP